MQTGERYGRLTVISLDASKATCRCDCGNTISVFRGNLTSGRTKSCGCLQKYHVKPGDRFGILTVLSIEENGKILCRCDCGNTVSVFRGNLTAGNTKSCGCQQNIKKYKPGDRFGRLIVISFDGVKATCRCDCGNEVSVLRCNLSSGNTKSCGCLRKKHVISPGDRFGKLTVLSEQKGGKILCRCDCGKEVSVARCSLTSGGTKSCGCKRNKTEFRLKPGDRFGMLTILSDQNSRSILCRCDCGNEVSVRRYSLKSGITRSCGCQCRNKKKASTSNTSITPITSNTSNTSNPDS